MPCKGNGKITQERISKLEGIGFEWDPQNAKWEIMFQRLKNFKVCIYLDEYRCNVPRL
jgi:hypothetical protein